MPTKRSWILLILALAIYFLANQTQVGWLYIITDGIIALLIVAFFYPRGVLKSIQVHRVFRNMSTDSPSQLSFTKERRVGKSSNGNKIDNLDLLLPTFHEDDPIEVRLQFSHHSFRPALLVSGDESCPFARPSDQTQPLFMPGLFKGQPVNLSYQTNCDRRGLYRFSKLRLHSNGAFGLFGAKRTLAAPSEILIYPSYHPLKRLRLLEHKGFSDRQALRTGLSSEVLGTREYRPGDSLRQIHWRSTARTGKLVVKEFADYDQLTMSVVLDLERGGNIGLGKFSTFETAIRLAASFGYYAGYKNVPFHLVGASKKWRPPATPLSWETIMNYLAKVDNDGQQSLANVLTNLPALPFVVVLVSNPNQAIARAIRALSHRGTQTLAIFITPEDATAPMAPAPKAVGLEITNVSPFNWPEVLADL